MTRPRAVAAGCVAAVLVAAAVVRNDLNPPLLLQGVALDADGRRVQIGASEPASFIPGTSLLVPAGARGQAGAPVAPAEVVAAHRAWLDQGSVPGRTADDRELAARALLDLRTLTVDGSAVAAWRSRWRYVWPRDASFVAVAYAVTGHHGDAWRVLARLAELQEEDGTWQARYALDGTVPDGRGRQLDGNGWVLWAAWLCHALGIGDPAVAEALDEVWPALATAADAAAASLGRDGLPPPGQDYWEVPAHEVTLGLAAPLLAGLRSAADLALATGRTGDARRWASSAEVLAAAVDREFGVRGYPRLPARSARGALAAHGYPRPPALPKLDTAVTFLAPPFGPPDPRVSAAVRLAESRLRLDHGGVRPGEQWRNKGQAWTPSTAMFALAAAASGDTGHARELLDWLSANRTAVGSLPERVAVGVGPVSVAPLAWTAATVVITLAALERPLPTPPATPPR